METAEERFLPQNSLRNPNTLRTKALKLHPPQVSPKNLTFWETGWYNNDRVSCSPGWPQTQMPDF